MASNLHGKQYIPACVGCGYCCKKAPCYVGSMMQGRSKPPCDYLRYFESAARYFCMLVVDAPTPEDQEERMCVLNVAEGCCASLNTDRQLRVREPFPCSVVLRPELAAHAQVLLRDVMVAIEGVLLTEQQPSFEETVLRFDSLEAFHSFMNHALLLHYTSLTRFIYAEFLKNSRGIAV